MPGSRPTWYLTDEYIGRDPACDLQKLQVAPLAVPLLLEGRVELVVGEHPIVKAQGLVQPVLLLLLLLLVDAVLGIWLPWPEKVTSSASPLNRFSAPRLQICPLI
jgi:hypothetical protein